MSILISSIIATIIISFSLFTSSSTLKLPLPKPIPTPTKQTTNKLESKVTYVFDGDTFQISSGEIVRYIGIDAPEVNSPYGPLECFGEEAKKANRQLVAGQTVTLESDISNTDKYGRLLRHVWIGDELISEKLITNGYALAASYPPDVKYQDRLSSAQYQAQAKLLGRWKICDND